MSANFITGTGTDIGKTWLACALLRHWRAAGRPASAIKPLLSGFDAADAAASDAGQLLTALGRPITSAELDAVAPWRFVAPLSPDMAAAREGREIDFAALVGFTRRAVDAAVGPLLVEGVGGVMVPLDRRHTVRDWIVASGLSSVLVTGSYLGSLSHALTALAALNGAGAGSLCVPGMPLRGQVTAIVVNESPGSTVPLDATLESLSRHAPGIPLLAIERAKPEAGVARLAELLE